MAVDGKVCFVYSVKPGISLRTRFFWSTSGSVLRGIEKSLRARSLTLPEKVTKEQYEAIHGPVTGKAIPLTVVYNIALEEPTDEMKLWRLKNRQMSSQSSGGNKSATKRQAVSEEVVEAV